MSINKQRLTITVDPDLIDAGQQAVASGAADSMSGWVSAALAEKLHRDQKLAELATAVADFEAEFGEITPDEIAAQRRSDRGDATVVRRSSGRTAHSA